MCPKREAMRQLTAHVASRPALYRRPAPQRLNLLDLEPPNALERRALHALAEQSRRGDTQASVLQELVSRMARALESYRSHYPPPIS